MGWPSRMFSPETSREGFVAGHDWDKKKQRCGILKALESGVANAWLINWLFLGDYSQKCLGTPSSAPSVSQSRCFQSQNLGLPQAMCIHSSLNHLVDRRIELE